MMGKGHACSQSAWNGADSLALVAEGAVTISTAQMAYLLDGIIAMPQKTWHPQAAG